MQEQIEELEYIKSNLRRSPTTSILANETDENETDGSVIDPRFRDNEARRRSALYLQEAQRLANERRTSLARTTTLNESIPENSLETSSVYDNDSDNESLFDFDQRSDETIEPANLSDVDEVPAS